MDERLFTLVKRPRELLQPWPRTAMMNLKSRLLRWGKKGREERRVEGRRGLERILLPYSRCQRETISPFIISIYSVSASPFYQLSLAFLFFYFFSSSKPWPFSPPPLTIDVSVFWFFFRGSKVGTSFWVTWKVKIFPSSFALRELLNSAIQSLSREETTWNIILDEMFEMLHKNLIYEQTSSTKIDAKRLEIYPLIIARRGPFNPSRIKEEGNFLVALTRLIFDSLFKRFR